MKMKFTVPARKEPSIEDVRNAFLKVYRDAYHGDRWVKIYDSEDNIRKLVGEALDLDNFKYDVDVYATIVKMDDHCIAYL